MINPLIQFGLILPDDGLKSNIMSSFMLTRNPIQVVVVPNWLVKNGTCVLVYFAGFSE